jgi:hypothetical protein
MELFATVLDQSLQEVNSDYEAKRYRSIALREPLVRQVASGTFAAWLKLKGKLGGQHKVPRLSNDRSILEEIFQLNNPTFVTP